jgi:hypothetical protein
MNWLRRVCGKKELLVIYHFDIFHLSFLKAVFGLWFLFSENGYGLLHI